MNQKKDHLRLLDIKPLRRDPELFQAIFKISKQLRLLLERKNDRLIIGITSCKVYDRPDRLFVKRCAHCQRYGHFQAQCEHKEDPRCARCGGNHETINCKDETVVSKCINCVRAGHASTDHSSSYHKCPVYLSELEKAKKLAPNHLN